jgi:hypothetical protein
MLRAYQIVYCCAGCNSVMCFPRCGAEEAEVGAAQVKQQDGTAQQGPPPALGKAPEGGGGQTRDRVEGEGVTAAG